ncbi:MAG: hypothetical protein LIO53_06940 [Oscillospiraceae bacterium]|nr:hypothetical protein [Oscillospiraceae bacterium]
MKKQFKKLLSAALSLAMVAGTVVLPITASADITPLVDGDTVIEEWNFYFGDELGTGYEDYTLVTPGRNYTESGDYGFIGTNENDYKLAGGRIDGFVQQEGQVITLTAGANGGIGSTGEDDFGNAGDEYYPTRFALSVDDDTYYRVKATVTTLDPEQNATASLYTERKHPLYTEKTITARTTVETEFTVRVTPVYYQKSDPTGTIADEVLSVCVLGENTALLSLQIQQVETAPVIWVLGDSTVTDGGGDLPFFPLQNYTGVGAGLTKYLPSTIAMVNEGEGGLSATDSYHFGVVSSRIKAGDYLYVEYGHNHKNSSSQSYTSEYWLHNYLSALPKYYDACKSTTDGGKATLIVVGPIDRHNSSQYDSTTNEWSSTLNSFSELGENYVKCLMYGGEETATSYVSKWAEIAAAAEAGTDTTTLKAEADAIVSALGTEVVIDNVAFVDLNQPSLDWYKTLSASGTVADTAVTNDYKLTNFYFQTAYGSSATDGTHPNDTGAENLAYFFFTTADTGTYTALKPLMTNFEDGAEHEEPISVSAEVINLGYPANSAWPQYITPTSYEYPIVIKDVDLEEGTLTAYVQASFSNYASGVLEVLDSDGNVVTTYVTEGHIDPTNGTGTNVLVFASAITLEEDQTYQAYMWSCDLTTEQLMTEEEGGEQLSSIYTPTEIDTYLLPGDESDIETFDYYGKTSLTDVTSYQSGGSSGFDTTLGTDDSGVTYANIINDGSGNSWTLMRAFENLDGGTGTNGKYMVDLDMIYISGTDFTFEFTGGRSNSSPFISGSTLELFTVGSNGAITSNGQSVGTVSATAWTNIKYIIDMNTGDVEVSIAGGTPITYNLSDYATYSEPDIDSMNYFAIVGGKAVACGVKLSNMTVAKLKDSGETTTINLSTAYSTDAEETNTTFDIVTGCGYESANLIFASYKSGALVDVSIQTLTDITAEHPVSVTIPELAEGDELRAFLWKSMENMYPIKTGFPEFEYSDGAWTVVDEETEDDTETVDYGTAYVGEDTTAQTATVSQGETVTVTAVANTGYVFTGWYNGSTLFSTDAEIDVRMYKDLDLTAKFALQSGVDDVTSVAISGDKNIVTAGTEQTVTFTVDSALDSDGNQCAYSASDVLWSVDTEGVSVVDGVLTIPADYAAASFRDTVTVTATINGVSATASVKVYASEYYEDFSTITSVSEWITDSSSNSISSIIDTSSASAAYTFAGMAAAGNGNVLFLGNNSNGTGKNFAYSRDMGVSTQTKLYFGFDIEPYQIRTTGSSAVTLQFVDTDGTTVFTINVNTCGGNSSFGGTEVSGFAVGTAVTVDTVLDFDNKTMTYTLTSNAGKVLASGSAELTAANLDRMYYSGDWQYGGFAIDNVYIDYETE